MPRVAGCPGLGLAAAAAVLLSIGAYAESPMSPAALAKDDECAAGAEAGCSLSALQRRVRAEAVTAAQSLASVHAVAQRALARLQEAVAADVSEDAACATARHDIERCSTMFNGKLPSPKLLKDICRCVPTYNRISGDPTVSSTCPVIKIRADVDLSVTHTLCDKCLMSAYDLIYARPCMDEDAQGQPVSLKMDAVCSSTCRPLLCGIASQCSPKHEFSGILKSMFSPDFSAGMVANVTGAVSGCPCGA